MTKASSFCLLLGCAIGAIVYVGLRLLAKRNSKKEAKRDNRDQKDISGTDVKNNTLFLMFQPQPIRCPHCNYEGHIIPEDIPQGVLKVHRDANGKVSINATIKCPSCGNSFSLDFGFDQSKGEEYFFKCVTSGYQHITMWRRMEGLIPKVPSYRPVRSRTEYEKWLDNRCKSIADLTKNWKEKKIPSNELMDILEANLEDYTKDQTWQTFKDNHYIVNVCSQDGTYLDFKGFNGTFSTIPNKSSVLVQQFVDSLGNREQKYSNQFCNNRIGCCAEAHSANRCLTNSTTPEFDKLVFSLAYICRNALPRSYCMNCLALFKSLKNG